ncbi:transferase, partial [Salinisphaera sp. USBA-960]|nr:transferase [Salifodinibacter halophilus]
PAAIEWETRAAHVGEQWTSTLYVAEYPDHPSDGYLSDLFELTDVEFDLTAHVSPKNQERARTELEEIADDLQVDADLEQSVRGAYLQERADEAKATYKAVE